MHSEAFSNSVQHQPFSVLSPGPDSVCVPRERSPPQPTLHYTAKHRRQTRGSGRAHLPSPRRPGRRMPRPTDGSQLHPAASAVRGPLLRARRYYEPCSVRSTESARPPGSLLSLPDQLPPLSALEAAGRRITDRRRPAALTCSRRTPQRRALSLSSPHCTTPHCHPLPSAPRPTRPQSPVTARRRPHSPSHGRRTPTDGRPAGAIAARGRPEGADGRPKSERTDSDTGQEGNEQAFGG